MVSSEDQALFLSAVAGARPLAARDRVAVPPPPPSPAHVAPLPPEIALVVEGDGQRYVARAPGVNRAQVHDLRTGKLHVEETLDLHGETVAQGIARLREFLARTSSLRRCVLVVHGKGLHSEHGAPLREAVLSELLGACSGFVHALASAVPRDGGEGATYILLRGHR